MYVGVWGRGIQSGVRVTRSPIHTRHCVRKEGNNENANRFRVPGKFYGDHRGVPWCYTSCCSPLV